MSVPPMEELLAPNSWRTLDFISDLHLSADEPSTVQVWQDYLLATPADAVFILGDFFEVWIGDDCIQDSNPRASPTARESALSFEAHCAQQLEAAGRRLALFFMHGNRDFLVGQTLMSRCHARLLADPCVLTFESQRWLLSHGDALCLGDSAYLKFRQEVRGASWQQQFLSQSLMDRRQIAREIRAQSEARKKTAEPYADVDGPAARQWLQAASAITLIHGHTHLPQTHDLGDGLRRVVLSDWDAAALPPRAEILRLSAEGLRRIPLTV